MLIGLEELRHQIRFFHMRTLLFTLRRRFAGLSILEDAASVKRKALRLTGRCFAYACSEKKRFATATPSMASLA